MTYLLSNKYYSQYRFTYADLHMAYLILLQSYIHICSIEKRFMQMTIIWRFETQSMWMDIYTYIESPCFMAHFHVHHSISFFYNLVSLVGLKAICKNTQNFCSQQCLNLKNIWTWSQVHMEIVSLYMLLHHGITIYRNQVEYEFHLLSKSYLVLYWTKEKLKSKEFVTSR